MSAVKPYGYRLRRALLIAVFALFSVSLLLATDLVATYLPRTDTDSVQVTLPDLVGTMYEQEDDRLSDEWYQVVFDYRSDASTVPGTVLLQDPAPGAVRRVIPDRSPCVVRLTLSTGAATFTLPPLIGTSAREAQVTLRAAGLIVQMKTQTRNDLSPGQILSVSPAEGTVMRQGEVVTLTQSEVTTRRTVRVPDVIGMEQGYANSTMVLRGLRPSQPTYEASSFAPGTVISQRPLAGTLVPADTGASLVISRGGAAEEELELESE